MEDDSYLRNEPERLTCVGEREISGQGQEEAKVLIYYKNHKICIPNSLYFFLLKYLFLGMNFSSFLPFSLSRVARILSSFFGACLLRVAATGGAGDFFRVKAERKNI